MSTIEPLWPADRHPTSEEWVTWFLAHDEQGRLDVAAKCVDMMSDVNHCLSSGACWINR